NDDLTCEWQPIPYVQSESEAGARRMTSERQQTFLSALKERSSAIQKPGRVQSEWDQFCAERHNYFMSSMLGHNRLLRRLNRDSGAVARLYPEDRFLLMTNILRCEIHRETALTVLRHHFERVDVATKTNDQAHSADNRQVPAHRRQASTA